jgi:hypothetical protein
MPDTAADSPLECLVEALQTFAFIAAEPPDGPVPAPAAADLYTLRFTGRFSGEFQLAAPREFGCLMAANLLGLEPTDVQAAERAQDVLKELCNVTTGLWLQRRVGDEVSEMGLPAADPLADWDGFAARPGSFAVRAEGCPLVARLEELP